MAHRERHFPFWLIALLVVSAPAAAPTSPPSTTAPATTESATDLEAVTLAMARVGAAWSPSLSPDGRRIAFVTRLSGSPQVWPRRKRGGRWRCRMRRVRRFSHACVGKPGA